MSKTKAPLTIVTHSDNPPLARLNQILTQQGWQPQIACVQEGIDLPPVAATQGVIVLGAAANVSQRHENEWAMTELHWLEEVLKQKTPVYGICYGCHLLAQIYGGRVFTGEYGREFGFTTVTQVQEDFLFTADLDGLDVFQAHGETYTLPTTAKRLMTGEVYQEQAAKFADNVYGTQFHPEVTPDVVARWHQSGLKKGRIYPPNVPPKAADHQQLAAEKLPPIHDWLAYFLESLFQQPQG